jgi:N-sulfoglucosamine sulfohydrolase
MSGASWTAMVRAGESDPTIRDRCEYYLYRTPEEFFMVGNDDGDERSNLVAEPAAAGQVAAMRAQLLEWMKKQSDPLADDFHKLISTTAPPPVP